MCPSKSHNFNEYAKENLWKMNTGFVLMKTFKTS